MKESMWRRAAITYLAPELPGRWHAASSVLYREPLDWIITCLSLRNSKFSSDFTVSAKAHLLAVPANGLPGPYLLTLQPARGLWKAPATLPDAEPIMREIAELAREKALPFLDRMGTIAGYRAAAEAEAQQWPLSVASQETAFCIRLIDGDVPAALEAATAVRHAVAANTNPYHQEAGRRVARAAQLAQENLPAALHQLREQTTHIRTILKLPPDPTLHAPT